MAQLCQALRGWTLPLFVRPSLREGKEKEEEEEVAEAENI